MTSVNGHGPLNRAIRNVNYHKLISLEHILNPIYDQSRAGMRLTLFTQSGFHNVLFQCEKESIYGLVL